MGSASRTSLDTKAVGGGSSKPGQVYRVVGRLGTSLCYGAHQSGPQVHLGLALCCPMLLGPRTSRPRQTELATATHRETNRAAVPNPLSRCTPIRTPPEL